MIKLPKVLLQPKLPVNLPSTAQWLAGEGAGSWFVIEQSIDYEISRYSPEGKLECKGQFKAIDTFELSTSYKIAYPSHCLRVTVIQNKLKVTFERIE